MLPLYIDLKWQLMSGTIIRGVSKFMDVMVFPLVHVSGAELLR